jgi:hypothetical protein
VVTRFQRRIDRARADEQRIRQRVGADVRLARHGAGVSVEAAAAAVGLSASTYRRIELAQAAAVTVGQLSLACASVGLLFRASAYPAGRGVRDAGHGRLLDRLRQRLPPGTPWQTEVPVPLAGDLRGWDAMAVLDGRRIGIEAEMRLTDAQAVDRRIALKRRDSGLELVVLLLPITHWNRSVLAADRELLRANFPLDTRAMLEAMRRGKAPAQSGIVLL